MTEIILRIYKRDLINIMNSLDSKPDHYLQDMNFKEIADDIGRIPDKTDDVNIHVLMLNLVHRLMQEDSLSDDEKGYLKAIRDNIYQCYGGQNIFDDTIKKTKPKAEEQTSKSEMNASLLDSSGASSYSGAFDFIVGFVCGGSNDTSMSTYYLASTSNDFALGYGAGLFSNAVSSSTRNSSGGSNSSTRHNSSGASNSSGGGSVSSNNSQGSGGSGSSGPGFSSGGSGGGSGGGGSGGAGS